MGTSHPFYQRLNQILDESKFDEYVETICQDFDAGEAAGRVCQSAAENRSSFDHFARPAIDGCDGWTHPHDPDARITRMKDRRTHLAHKAEHVVDLETRAIVAVTLHLAAVGATATIPETVAEVGERITSLYTGKISI